MSDLETLNYKSILEMGDDEAIERLRQIRLSRRIPKKSKKATRAKQKKAKQKAIPKLTKQQAIEILKILGGK